MRGVWSSLVLAWSLPTSVFSTADPIAAADSPNQLIARQTTNNSSNPGAATWIFVPQFGRGRRGPGRDIDGDGQGPPPGRGPPAGVDVDDDDDGPAGGNFTFSITVNPDNDDMWFRIAAPSMYSWVGIGAGNSMGNAKGFLMAWEGRTDDSVVLTARGTCDQCEPAYWQDFNITPQTSTNTSDPSRLGIRGGMSFINGFVANGTRRFGIDPRSTTQSFIWAVGPRSYHPRTDDPRADLRMHALHGGFALDMTRASGRALPAFQTVQNGVARQGGGTRDHERASTAHAVAMGIGFVLVLPLGIVLLRWRKSVVVHMYTQAVGFLIVSVGWGVGFYISKKYQRSMDYNSPHQIIGITTYILLLIQYTLGFTHHLIYKKTQQPTWMIKPHKYGLGGVVLALGIVNMAVGFRFAMAPYYNIIFVPIIIALCALLIGVIVFRSVRRRRRARAGTGTLFGGPAPPQNYQAPQGSAVPPPHGGVPQGGYYGQPSAASSTVGASGWGNRDEVELNKMGPPPSYSTEPQKPRELV